VLEDVTVRQTAALCAALEAYALDDAETAAATAALQTAARETTDRMLQDAVASVVVRMREKFQQGFLKTADGMARSWTASLDIGKVAKEAKRAAARVLALITVCQLDAADGDDDGDEETEGEDVALVGPSAMVEEALCALLDGGGDAAQKFGLPYWKGFEGSTLVQPPKCRELWRQFNSEVEVYITQAVSHQVRVMMMFLCAPRVLRLDSGENEAETVEATPTVQGARGVVGFALPRSWWSQPKGVRSVLAFLSLYPARGSGRSPGGPHTRVCAGGGSTRQRERHAAMGPGGHPGAGL
jgi:hypothetical protein